MIEEIAIDKHVRIFDVEHSDRTRFIEQLKQRQRDIENDKQKKAVPRPSTPGDKPPTADDNQGDSPSPGHDT